MVRLPGCAGGRLSSTKGEKNVYPETRKATSLPPFPASESSCCFFQGCFWGEMMHSLQRTPLHWAVGSWRFPPRAGGTQRPGWRWLAKTPNYLSQPLPDHGPRAHRDTTKGGAGREPRFSQRSTGTRERVWPSPAPREGAAVEERSQISSQPRQRGRLGPKGWAEVPRRPARPAPPARQWPRVPKSPRPAAALWLGAVRRRRSGCFHRPGRRRRTSP